MGFPVSGFRVSGLGFRGSGFADTWDPLGKPFKISESREIAADFPFLIQWKFVA